MRSEGLYVCLSTLIQATKWIISDVIGFRTMRAGKKTVIFLKRQRSRDMPNEKANLLELVYTLSLGTLETQGGTTKGVCRLPYAIY